MAGQKHEVRLQTNIPAIHVLVWPCVDARDKPGHDAEQETEIPGSR